jgi:hypothetical protein
LKKEVLSSFVSQQNGSVGVVKEISNDVKQFVEQLCGSSRNHCSISWPGHFESLADREQVTGDRAQGTAP